MQGPTEKGQREKQDEKKTVEVINYTNINKTNNHFSS